MYPKNDGIYYGPGYECGTCSVSMALSYVGINKTPKNILDAHNGVTYFSRWGADLIYPSVPNGINNYINGNGKYSPVIVHFKRGGNYSNGHYVLLVGKVSADTYQVVDCANNSTWNLSTYSSLYSQIDQVMQYYNVSSNIPSGGSYASISGYNVPGNINVGKCFSIKGTISSSTNFTSVNVGVYTASSGGSCKTGRTVNPNAAIYNLKNIDPYILFNKLSAGTYYYRVTAKNSKGTKTLVNSKFTVK